MALKHPAQDGEQLDRLPEPGQIPTQHHLLPADDGIELSLAGLDTALPCLPNVWATQTPPTGQYGPAISISQDSDREDRTLCVILWNSTQSR